MTWQERGHGDAASQAGQIQPGFSPWIWDFRETKREGIPASAPDFVMPVFKFPSLSLIAGTLATSEFLHRLPRQPRYFRLG
jgi:hypothetical protein